MQGVMPEATLVVLGGSATIFAAGVIPAIGNIDVADVGVVAELIEGVSAIIGEGAGGNHLEKS
uniref:Uncharacterized protein n=1 Tax=Romanomermis culicivorax TaxID=13658 RepID=A0A915K4M7_ROMCU